MIRIFFTSVGRRVELMQAFRAAAEESGEELFLYGGDIAESAPALFYVDEAVKIPLISDDSYIPFLREFCEKNKVDLLIPTIDTDLLLLAKHRDEFGDTRVVISAPGMIAVCRDKNNTADFFASCGLAAPVTTNDVEEYISGGSEGMGSFPAFIKPKDGSSSIDAYAAKDAESLRVYAQKIGDYVIQPLIEGEEYTVDILCDFDGSPIYITPRIRLAVRAGEVLKTRIAQDEKIISEMRSLIDAFKPCGPLTVQLIRDKKTGDDYYIEINPRFGGGAPLSIKAGANAPKALLSLVSGENPGYQEKAAEDGAVYSRFDQSVRVN